MSVLSKKHASTVPGFFDEMGEMSPTTVSIGLLSDTVNSFCSAVVVRMFSVVAVFSVQ